MMCLLETVPLYWSVWTVSLCKHIVNLSNQVQNLKKNGGKNGSSLQTDLFEYQETPFLKKKTDCGLLLINERNTVINISQWH